MRILFYDNSLCLRGTTIALYDYAYYNEELLGNTSIVTHLKNNPNNNTDVIEKFKKRFDVHSINSFNDIHQIIKDQHIDVLYMLKSGTNDGHISTQCRTCVHCVFNATEPHGDVYSAVSPYIKGYKDVYPWVPHMINLPDVDGDMRDELKIPKDATVFGRIGGFEQFDIQFVRDVVRDVARQYPNIYFLFVNTRPINVSCPNIIYLPFVVDLKDKRRFINTCDAMLWARSGGETFGLAIGEFSSCNKPVIATKCGDQAHVHLLGDKGIWYSGPNDLRDILTGFDKLYYQTRDNNAFKEFSPQRVMETFKKAYLEW